MTPCIPPPPFDVTESHCEIPPIHRPTAELAVASTRTALPGARDAACDAHAMRLHAMGENAEWDLDALLERLALGK
jgi:hypothetical protein